MTETKTETPQEALSRLLSMSGNLSLEQLDEVARLMMIVRGEGS